MPSLAMAPEGDDLSLTEGAAANSGVCGQLCKHLLQEVNDVAVTTIVDHHLTPPHVCLLLVGRHPAALSYASSTVAAAKAAGVMLVVWKLPDTATHAEVAHQIALANSEPSLHGARLLRVQEAAWPPARPRLAASRAASTRAPQWPRCSQLQMRACARCPRRQAGAAL